MFEFVSVRSSHCSDCWVKVVQEINRVKCRLIALKYTLNLLHYSSSHLMVSMFVLKKTSVTTISRMLSIAVRYCYGLPRSGGLEHASKKKICSKQNDNISYKYCAKSETNICLVHYNLDSIRVLISRFIKGNP